MYVSSVCMYLEFSIGLADVDNELVPLFLQIRALQSHHVTVICTCIHVHMFLVSVCARVFVPTWLFSGERSCFFVCLSECVRERVSACVFVRANI